MARGNTLAIKGAAGGSLLPWLGLALILVIADQFTKVLILGYYHLGDSTYVTSFLNIVRAHNTGAAFSFLAAASGWQRWLFTGIALCAVLFILYLLRSHAHQKLFSFSLACILGGADRERDRPAAAWLRGGLHPGALAVGLVLPGVQHRRQRDHDRGGVPDPGRAVAGAAGALKPLAPSPACGRGWG